MKEKYLIYIIEDDPIYLKMLVDVVSEFSSFEIRAFSSGENALNGLKNKPHVLITDYLLDLNDENARNGLQILKSIKTALPNVEVIVLSGQLMPDVTFDFIFTYNVRNYIVKDKNAFDNLRKELVNVLHDLSLKQ